MYTILIVGFGSIGKRHLKNILENFDAKVILCTKRTDLKKYEKNGVIIEKSLSDALKHEPNIAFVTNETSYHVKTALKLAKKGIHLFLEKPLSDSMKDVKKLEKLIFEKKLVTQIGCNMRFHPCIVKIKKILNEKKLGKIISTHVESSSYLPDWHPYEDYRYGYAARKDLGGGIALTCIHELDFLYWFFGDVNQVFSIIGKFSDLQITADDLSVMTFIFKSKVIGELHLDYFQRPDFKSCTIKGTKGTLFWDSSSNEVKIFYRTKKSWKSELKITAFEKNSMYVDELKYFLNCIKTQKKSMNDISDGIRTLEIVLAAKKSSKIGKLLTIK